MTKTLTILATAGLLLGGCYFDFDGHGSWSEEPAPYGGSSAGYGTPLTIEGADLRGSMGTVDSTGGGVWLQEGYFDGYMSQIEVQSQGSGWAMMGMVTVEGDVANMEPGTVVTSSPDYYASGQHVDVLGCSGPSQGEWYFDRPADEVTIAVGEGSTPDSRRCDVTATFAADGTTPAQVAVVSFEIARR